MEIAEEDYRQSSCKPIQYSVSYLQKTYQKRNPLKIQPSKPTLSLFNTENSS